MSGRNDELRAAVADIDTLRSLRERVIGATGADREIDHRIAKAVGFTRERRQNMTNGHTGMRWRDPDGRLVGWTWTPPPYTASLDAAVALVKQCLPGYRGDIDIAALEPDVTLYGARLFPPGDTHFYQGGEGATSPLALLSALLSALIARAEETTP